MFWATWPLIPVLVETMAPQLNITRLMCARQSFVKSRAPLEDNAYVLMEVTTAPLARRGAPPLTAAPCTRQKCASSVKSQSEWWDEQTSCAMKSRGEPVRILERGMDYPRSAGGVRMTASAAAIRRDCLRHGRISIAVPPSPWMPPTVATKRCWPTSGIRTLAPGARSACAGWKTAYGLPTTAPAVDFR